MRKNILNITLAASIALAGFGATPAAARDDDALGQFLFGALALVVIGKALKDRDDDRQQVQTHTPRPRPQANPTPRPRKVLPARCIRRHDTRAHGRVRMAAKRCLRNNYDRFNRLPDHCFQRVRTTAGDLRRGFGVRCLKRRGYTFR